MDENYINYIDGLYRELMSANYKAVKASINYNKHKDIIVADEIAMNTKMNYKDKIAQQRIDDKVDNNKVLKKYYSSYTFWTSEVTRVSNLLQGIQATLSIKNLYGEPTVLN